MLGDVELLKFKEINEVLESEVKEFRKELKLSGNSKDRCSSYTQLDNSASPVSEMLGNEELEESMQLSSTDIDKLPAGGLKKHLLDALEEKKKLEACVWLT